MLLSAPWLTLTIEASENNAGRPIIPEDLLDDDHVREEYGINEFTTPSIGRLFQDLDELKEIPYDKLKPIIPQRLSSERSQLALSLGVLIADGFLAVQEENIEDIESIGRSILDTAKALGAGKRISQHGKALLENSLLGNWQNLKSELAATQKDVELEMLLLRDHEIAHLVSLGGWIRALEIACTTALESQEQSIGKIIDRPEVIDYFSAELATLHPRLLKKAHIVNLRKEITSLQSLLEIQDSLQGSVVASPTSESQLRSILPALQNHSQNMVAIIRQTETALSAPNSDIPVAN